MDLRYHVGRCCTVAALALAMGVSPPAAGQAKVGCVGAACRGRDPQAMGCARDARTLATAYADGNFRVEPRYSPACNARWARTTYLNGRD